MLSAVLRSTKFNGGVELLHKNEIYNFKLILDTYPPNDITCAIIYCEAVYDYTTTKQCMTTKYSFYFLNQQLSCILPKIIYIRA